MRGEPSVPLPLKREVIRRKVKEEKEVTIFRRIFPIPKTDKEEGIRRKKVKIFIASAEFAANMASESESIKGKDLTHTIAKHFRNSSIELKFIRRLGHVRIIAEIKQLSSLRLVSTSTSSILNHFLSLYL